jgi:hypothetical protein
VKCVFYYMESEGEGRESHLLELESCDGAR